MAIKLILSDIDGTLLPRGQKELSPRVFEAFHAALDAGLAVGPATGRALPAVLPTFQNDAACVQTALATNGMQVYAGGELIHEEYLDHEGLVALAEATRQIPGAGMICFRGAEVYLVCGEREVLAPIFPAYAEDPIRVDSVPDFPVVKANLFIDADLAGTRDFMDRIAAEVPQLGYNLPLPGFLNVVPLGYSKATGIDIICRHMGISLDEVVVFGDAGNDAEMLGHVPNSVAVANAVPEVAAIARWHVGAAKDDAVPAAIAALAAGEWPFTE